MLKRVLPELGAWYQDIERDLLFKIIDLDEDVGFIAAQHFDGEIEELDLESFFKMPLKCAEPPEDWTGPYELDYHIEDEEYLDNDPLPPLASQPFFEPYESDVMQIEREP